MSPSVFSDRIGRLRPSPSSAASQRARELQEAGEDIISLTSGEPDFDTPEHIIDAAIAAMKSGQTRYTAVNGTVALKQAVVEKFRRENGLEYAASEVMAATGCKQIIFNALLATVQTGDEVIIPSPYWVSYPDITQLCGGTPVTVECRLQTGFKLGASELEQAITPRTRWLILNTPCNPSGAVYGREELAALGRVLAAHPHVWVMTDDVYEHILMDGRNFETIASVCPDLKSRVLTVNGVSKAYAMTGWRIGYCGGPAELIREMTKLQSQSTSNPCSIAQAAAVAALNGPQDFIAEFRAAYQKRRDMVHEALLKIEGISCSLPEGAFYMFPNCSGLIGKTTPDGKRIGSDQEFCAYLLEHAGVATVHGSAFGMSPHFRISLAKSEAELVEGLDRIAKACAQLRP